ncbi:MAG: hypothetical protein QXZ56_07570 [Sulfolobales archaeon]
MGEVIKDLVKDVRSDVKKLIELLTALNDHLARLESFVTSLDRLSRELEEANKNFKALVELLKELSK